MEKSFKRVLRNENYVSTEQIPRLVYLAFRQALVLAELRDAQVEKQIAACEKLTSKEVLA